MIRFITRSLDTAGIRHYVVSQPEHVLDAISEFNPDLVLMDMYMPDCDGYEVAKIIRQNDTLTSLPIVFLSSEQDLKKQLEVMTIGADDFLTKPIEPEHLVSSLNHRIKRHRILGSIMTQDSLTGLLNHTRIKQQLEESIKKASRSNLKMSFAMVDIDFFKKVNDSYGHPAGDSVIKSLSKFLQKRLRNTDIIGRYGGEEFAIIFWDTDADNALKVLDTIREEFAHIKHMAGDKTFFCTFSAGIADFSLFTESQIISEAADEALYKSKNKGRNCISIAEHI
jgi:diguanylate cyclase (GGDEF)-like protein